MQLNVYKVISKTGKEGLIGYIVVNKESSTIVACQGAPPELARNVAVPPSGITWGAGPFSATSPYSSEVGYFDLNGGSYITQTYTPVGGNVDDREYVTGVNISIMLQAEVALVYP